MAMPGAAPGMAIPPGARKGGGPWPGIAPGAPNGGVGALNGASRWGNLSKYLKANRAES